jgi:hypothetical protein
MLDFIHFSYFHNYFSFHAGSVAVLSCFSVEIQSFVLFFRLGVCISIIIVYFFNHLVHITCRDGLYYIKVPAHAFLRAKLVVDVVIGPHNCHDSRRICATCHIKKKVS